MVRDSLCFLISRVNTETQMCRSLIFLPQVITQMTVFILTRPRTVPVQKGASIWSRGRIERRGRRRAHQSRPQTATMAGLSALAWRDRLQMSDGVRAAKGRQPPARVRRCVSALRDQVFRFDRD